MFILDFLKKHGFARDVSSNEAKIGINARVTHVSVIVFLDIGLFFSEQYADAGY